FLYPSMIIAQMQTQGKGQKGNQWQSPANKNIYASFVLDTSFIPIEDQFLLSKIIALGTRNFLSHYIAPSRIQIKWPNDLYIDTHKKIAGILIENKIMGSVYCKAIAGVGVNFLQDCFPTYLPNPTSVILEAPSLTKLPSIKKAASELFDAILQVFQEAKQHPSSINEQYLAHLLFFQQRKPYQYKGERMEATIKGVDTYGHLQLETDTKSMITADLKELTYLWETDHIR
ncbi:MAG: biotin--[acetyl-CoA-carboxylase] ligase, partial [Bacteroidales bacterium]